MDVLTHVDLLICKRSRFIHLIIPKKLNNLMTLIGRGHQLLFTLSVDSIGTKEIEAYYIYLLTK